VYEILGNVGDFLGGVGVLVTLVYLAIQIRQNTNSARAATYQAATAALSEWTSAIGRDPVATGIFMRGSQNPEQLNETEHAQFSLLTVSILRHYENIHFQYSSGALDPGTWEGWASRMHGNVATPGTKAIWQGQRTAFSSEFRAFIDAGLVAAESKTNLPWSDD